MINVEAQTVFKNYNKIEEEREKAETIEQQLKEARNNVEVMNVIREIWTDTAYNKTNTSYDIISVLGSVNNKVVFVNIDRDMDLPITKQLTEQQPQINAAISKGMLKPGVYCVVHIEAPLN